MGKSSTIRSNEFYAQTYDVAVPDWPGEIDFYRSFAAETASKDESVLEVACGTGRIAIRLAQDGVRVVGLDYSVPMLNVARDKSRDLPNMEWVEADMRSFDLGERFGLIIIPGHAFQNLVEAQDQTRCLESVVRHLNDEGVLVIHVDHQSMAWLGDLVREKGGVFEAAGQFVHPVTGQMIHASRAWSYESATQTAIARTLWEQVDDEGKVTGSWEMGPIRLHCLFRFEMEHLLALTGLDVEAVYGNFFREKLSDNSQEMIWVAKTAR